jgi:methylamine dehydrogenase accessory protein MauD
MTTFLFVSNIILTIAVFLLGFLVLGALRALGLLSWRVEQLEVTTPSRLGREGLKVGKKALDFSLPAVVHAARVQPETNGDAAGAQLSLSDFSGRKVLLVFTQTGCGPCHEIMPELNRLHDKGQEQVLVVNNGDPEETRKWVAEVSAHFPVLAQEKFSLSKRYQVFATPFAFLIDEKGIISSKGIVGSREHLGYVLTGAGNRFNKHHEESGRDVTENGEAESSFSSKEVIHA